uniref:Uncharacterized protein n=1 Tax=Timema monikensis TaxID=170555 RepID=A0A7R9EJD0_9NEOP|nr:unnamed protein product [Timema monikensis]
MTEGKDGGSRSSLSVDSIDSRTSPVLDQHRRSKSILKKSDTGAHHHHHRSTKDSETEKLISDNTSGVSTSDNGGGGGDPGSGSGSDYSPNKLPLNTCALSPPHTPATAKRYAHTQSLRGIGPKLGPKPQALPIKFVGLGQMQDVLGKRPLKSHMMLLDDLLGGEKHSRDEAVVENKYKERLEGVCGALTSGDGVCLVKSPLYIYPPPPPLDDSSPTEETKLLLQQAASEMVATVNRQTAGGGGGLATQNRHQELNMS